MDEFVAWLNPKGVRELALKNALAKWWDLLAPGVRKRAAVSSFYWASYESTHIMLRISL